jgi:membrane protein YdbS with pleckstrin-like domain
MQFSLRPVFIGWIALLTQLPLQLFFTLWAGGFFGSMLMATGVFGRSSPWPFVIFGVVAFLGIPLVAYFGKKLNYGKTEYQFFDDRLEFQEGFFSVSRKTIKYSAIKEMTLRKGILQRVCGLGTIYLATLATGSSRGNNIFYSLGFGNVSASGVGVRDIRDPDQTYEQIKALVDRFTT